MPTKYLNHNFMVLVIKTDAYILIFNSFYQTTPVFTEMTLASN